MVERSGSAPLAEAFQAAHPSGSDRIPVRQFRFTEIGDQHPIGSNRRTLIVSSRVMAYLPTVVDRLFSLAEAKGERWQRAKARTWREQCRYRSSRQALSRVTSWSATRDSQRPCGRHPAAREHGHRADASDGTRRAPSESAGGLWRSGRPRGISQPAAPRPGRPGRPATRGIQTI